MEIGNVASRLCRIIDFEIRNGSGKFEIHMLKMNVGLQNKDQAINCHFVKFTG